MSLNTILRRAAVGTAVLASCAAVSLGASTGASAAPVAAARPVAVSPSVSFGLPGYGSNSTVPTWVFRNTLLCVFNAGYSTSTVKVQATIGFAGPEYMYVPPFQQQCISRWWAGNPVRVTNLSYNPLYVNAN